MKLDMDFVTGEVDEKTKDIQFSKLFPKERISKEDGYFSFGLTDMGGNWFFGEAGTDIEIEYHTNSKLPDGLAGLVKITFSKADKLQLMSLWINEMAGVGLK